MYRTLAIGILILFTNAACVDEILISKPDDSEDIRYDQHPKNLLYLDALKKYRDDTNSPGSILLIDKPQEDLWIGAIGKANLEYQRPVQTNNLIRTGSVTKMFTAVVIMKLVESDRLMLESKLVTVLPETSGNIPQADKITIRHLLAHLSGIVDPPNENLQYQSDIINNPTRMFNYTVDDLLKNYVYGRNLHFAPGSAYSYSNTNYWLLGQIAESITAKSMHELMEEMIFVPLQMEQTWLEIRDDKNVARGYVDLYGNGILMDVTSWDRAEGNGRADGGLISTADDLKKFMRGLFSGQLVSIETLEQMKTIQLADCNSLECEYGLGLEVWRTGAGTAYGHNGALVGLELNVLWYEYNGAISVIYKNNGNFSDKSWLDELVK
jgi:D-alanyl-D-alanine carboxypeptidase